MKNRKDSDFRPGNLVFWMVFMCAFAITAGFVQLPQASVSTMIIFVFGFMGSVDRIIKVPYPRYRGIIILVMIGLLIAVCITWSIIQFLNQNDFMPGLLFAAALLAPFNYFWRNPGGMPDARKNDAMQSPGDRSVMSQGAPKKN